MAEVVNAVVVRHGRRPTMTQPLRPAVFLDRDGVLVRQIHHLCLPSQIELLPGAIDAVRLINESGLLAIVITNQSVVARAVCTIQDVRGIHDLVGALLAQGGAHLDAVYFCPHAPSDDSNLASPPICRCRKPATGMIEQATKEWAVDLERSCFVGDTTVDVETAHRAGVTPLLVQTGYAGKDAQYDVAGVAVHDDVLAAVRSFLEQPMDRRRLVGHWPCHCLAFSNSSISPDVSDREGS